MSIDLIKPNMAYQTPSGDVAIVLDMFQSEHSNIAVLHVRFIRNIGDSRPYDTIEYDPDRDAWGIDEWEPADMNTVRERIHQRLQFIEKQAFLLEKKVEKVMFSKVSP